MDQHEPMGFQLLDEPARPRRRLASRELLLGLALLLVVAGWGGSDWWQQQARHSSYQAGRRYAEARDWVAARAAFLAAQGYGDAAEQVASASRHIDRRDATYAAARRAARSEQWAAALRDLRLVHEIQAGFQDNDLLIAQAEREVYRLALSGTVALRISAQPPGLYRYTPRGWSWLQDTDTASRVRGNGPGGCIVYDLPPSAASPGSLAAPAVEPRASVTGGVSLSARRLTVAHYEGGSFTTRPLALDPATLDSFACGEQGVIGWRLSPADPAAADPRLARVRTWLSGSTLAYQPYGGAPSSFRLPGAAWGILDIRQAEQRLVLGDYTSASGDKPRTVLYVTGPDGERLFVAEREAVVLAAWLSPDGRHLLTDEFNPLSDGVREAHLLALLTLDGSKPPVTLHQMQVRTDTPPFPDRNWYEVAFVESGPYSGRALIKSKIPQSRLLKLIDPTHPDQVVWFPNDVEYWNPLQVLVFDGGLVLPWTNRPLERRTALYLAAGGKTTRFNLDIGGYEELEQVWQSGGRLVYAWVSSLSGSIRGITSGVASIPVPAMDPSSSSLAHSFQADSSMARWAFSSRTAWSRGDGLLAYIMGGRLYARTYDGEIDLPLENGVLDLYDLQP